MYYNIQSSSLSGELILDMHKLKLIVMQICAKSENFWRKTISGDLKIPLSAEFYRIACMSSLLNIVL